MIYLKKFETQAAYNAAESSLILPNVSLITENNKVYYNPSTPPAPSHDYVEIAGIKWATMNIGANSVTDGGLYFAWAETSGYTAVQIGCEEGKKCFNLESYKYYDSSEYMTKYNDTDGKMVLDLSDDAVAITWGGSWRTPTVEEFETLITATTSAWTADYQGSGVAGVVLTDNTDNSKVLFFPAAGYCSNDVIYDDSEACNYWSSNREFDIDYGIVMYANSDDVSPSSYDTRWTGRSVRPILDE